MNSRMAASSPSSLSTGSPATVQCRSPAAAARPADSSAGAAASIRSVLRRLQPFPVELNRT
jgi:hypothetical protein